MTTAAIYCRVSTDDQEKEGTSLKTQMESCLNYCQEKGYEVSYRFSEAYSGLTLDRPKLRELQELIRAGYIDVIVIYCLDRISRDPTHGVILTQEFERFNVALEAVTEDINNSELGKLISYIRGFASKLEAEKIRERTMRGKQARLKEGKLPQGTGIGIYGYDWDKDTGRRHIIDQEAEVIRRIFNMAMLGTSTNKIALSLNQEGIRTKSGSLWYPLTVRRVLNNLAYTGKTYFGQTRRVNGRVEVQPKENWTLLPDITPPLITDEIFNRAQEAMNDARDSRPVKPNAAYLLTGFIRCPKCGSPIGGTTMNGKYRYYRCRGAVPTATRGKICDAGYIKANQLENDVWNKVIKMAFRPHPLISFLLADKRRSQNNDIKPLLDKQISQLRKKLKTYKTKEKNLISLLSHDNVTRDYVLESINKLKQERISDEKQLEALLETRKQSLDKKPITLKLSEYSEQIKNAINLADNSNDLLLKRSVLELLRLKVTADPQTYQFSIGYEGYLVSSSDEPLHDFINEKYEEFEKQHPEISLEDITDPGFLLPEDSQFSRIINPVKKKLQTENHNLVTIEQTSGCLSSHAYNYSIPFSFSIK